MSFFPDSQTPVQTICGVHVDDGNQFLHLSSSLVLDLSEPLFPARWTDEAKLSANMVHVRCLLWFGGDGAVGVPVVIVGVQHIETSAGARANLDTCCKLRFSFSRRSISLLHQERHASRWLCHLLLQFQMPGVNLPMSQIYYYLLTLFVCGVLHEVGHAVAAVRYCCQTL